jgi:Dehydrogenases (flavoproteins)
MPDADVIIVGAGLSGITAAYKLASYGRNVIVFERGEYPGSKNVTGGRMYLHAIKKIINIPLEEMPFERFVTREVVTVLHGLNSFSIELENYDKQKYQSATVLRAIFDKWYANLAEEKGANFITKTKVDDLYIEDGFVRGVIVENEKVTSNVVLISEGVNNFLGLKLGLRKEFMPNYLVTSAKAVIELGEEEINKRFRLKSREGIAQIFTGQSRGVIGGGFLYTNRETLSIGVVYLLESLVKNKVSIADLFEDFMYHPSVQKYIEGGRILEYSGHLIPVKGYGMIPKLVYNGALVSGDAAGFFLENGPIFRGMDFAIESGSLAAEAIERAIKEGDYSEKTLSYYITLLNNSFVLKDLKRHRNAPKIMQNERLYSVYPALINELLNDFFKVDGTTKQPLLNFLLNKTTKYINPIIALKDIIEILMYA